MKIEILFLKKKLFFLKVLIEAKTNLYEYIDGNLKTFFYKKDKNSSIEQLIFKEYTVLKSKFKKNNRYRQQIINNLNSNCVNPKKVAKIDYRKVELVIFFTEYNICIGADLSNKKEKPKRNALNFSAKNWD